MSETTTKETTMNNEMIKIENCEKVFTDSDRFVAVKYNGEIITFTRRRNGMIVEQGQKIGVGRSINSTVER